MAKSPSGSLCPYPYMGGELHPLKYGGFHADRERLLQVMAAEEAFILRSTGLHNRRVWIDLYETDWDDELLDALARHLKAIEHKLYRLCFAGDSHRLQRKLEGLLAAHGVTLREPVRFYADPEDGKQWLVGKQH